MTSSDICFDSLELDSFDVEVDFGCDALAGDSPGCAHVSPYNKWPGPVSTSVSGPSISSGASPA